MKRKKLPKDSHKGLCIYCSEKNCRKYFFWTKKTKKNESGKITTIEPNCGSENVKFSRCKKFHKHKFMARLCIPNSNNSRISKTFDVTQYDDAVKKTIEFKRQFDNEIISIDNYDTAETKSAYLFDAQIRYLDYLDNIDVPEHQKVQRTEKHIKEIAKCLELFNEALLKKRINKKVITIHKISDTHVGYFHSYLITDLEYANKTYNNKISALKSFFEWAIDHYNLKTINPFEKARLRSTKSNKSTITEEEFTALINPKNMCYEKGEVIIGLKKPVKRNHYRDYLAHGIELCLHTGGRREEVVELQWNMIHKIKGKLAYIEFNNLKVERIKGEGFNDNVDTNIIPITEDLKNLLMRLGYEQNKGTSNYILCPDRSNQTTQTIMDNLSKGFTHFYKLLDTGRELQLKCLRKTYYTYLKMAVQGDMRKLDSHSTDAVLDKHYIDERIINKAVANMSIFGKK